MGREFALQQKQHLATTKAKYPKKFSAKKRKVHLFTIQTRGMKGVEKNSLLVKRARLIRGKFYISKKLLEIQ